MNNFPNEVLEAQLAKYFEKARISHSEISDWMFCQHKHFLKYVLGHTIQENNPSFSFGTAIHSACEDYLNGEDKSAINKEVFLKKFNEDWEKYSFDKLPDLKSTQTDFLRDADLIMSGLPSFMKEVFPNGYEVVSTEEEILIDLGFKGMRFKGLVDAIVKEGDVYWILDWKTADSGWNKFKKEDFVKKAQLVLYKKYWAEKSGVPEHKIKTAFIILSRKETPSLPRFEFYAVNVNDLMKKEITLIMKNAIKSVASGVALKTGKMGLTKFNKPKNNCKFCVYKDMPNLCDGNSNNSDFVSSAVYQKFISEGYNPEKIMLFSDWMNGTAHKELDNSAAKEEDISDER